MVTHQNDAIPSSLSSTPVRIETDGGHHLEAERWGPSSGKPIILAHGGGQTRHSWKSSARLLAERGWLATAYDARGHGDSEWRRDEDYRLDGFVRDLERVVGPDASPVLVGASLGGMTSLVYAGNHPDRVRALILVDIAPRIDRGESGRIQAFMRGNAEGFASLDEAMDAVHAYNPLRPRPKSPEGLKRNMRLHEDGRWHWRWDPTFLRVASEASRDAMPGQLLAAAAKVKAPVLVIRGTQSQMVSDEAIAELKSLIGDVRYVDIAGAGHMVAGDDNDHFADAVLHFLDEIGVRP